MILSEELLGRWAGVMLNSAAYAEVIDRHVALYSRVASINTLLEYFEPTDDDPNRRRLNRSSPALELHGEFEDDWLSHNLVAIAQLAEELDRSTLQLALSIEPLDWRQDHEPPTAQTSTVEPVAAQARHSRPVHTALAGFLTGSVVYQSGTNLSRSGGICWTGFGLRKPVMRHSTPIQPAHNPKVAGFESRPRYPGRPGRRTCESPAIRPTESPRAAPHGRPSSLGG